ncbi:hypothetical protein AAG570_006578 [Ranatra chinensis]|uniref:Uncharacterized protein n=1 Tax=Ranatra chinensis TaxID=642074 RepID=A0ABD0YV09_9HEMI
MRAGVNKFKMITLGDELSVLKCGSSQFSYLPSVVYVIGMVMILNLTAGSHSSRNSLGFFGQPGKLNGHPVDMNLFQDLKVGRWITTLDNEGFGRYLKPLLNYLLDSGTIKVVILTIISFVPIIVSLVLKDDHSRFRLLW